MAWGLSARRYRDAPTLSTEDGYRAAIRSAQVGQAVGIACLVTGGALLVGGAVRLAIVRRRERREAGTLEGGRF